uniref:hypothetical protein n=1 Tax=Stappia sp. TaxID=1870903 RepID=UPI003BAA6548
MTRPSPRAERSLSLDRLAGLAVSVPLALVPGSAIAMMVWARFAFYQRHPDYVQESAPTISRAISDPFIGAPFAMTILAVTAVIFTALVFLSRAFQVTIAHVWHDTPEQVRRRSRLSRIMIACQVIGSSGMVLCTQYTFENGHDLHMLGSYLFFIFQMLAIGMNGFLCTRIVRADHGGPWPDTALSPVATRFRVMFSKVVVVAALIYFTLFAIKRMDLPVTEYTIYYVYTVQEIITISAFILYLMTFSLDAYRLGSCAVRSRLETAETA